MAADKDKEEFEKTKSKAEKGDRVAQHNLGLMYLDGEEVLQDYVTAYAWLNIAAANGNVEAAVQKPPLVRALGSVDTIKAQELSKEMVKKNPKLLKKN